MTGEPSSVRGHRTVAHTADVIVEAWGPDVASCCEEAVSALLEGFIDASSAKVVERLDIDLAPSTAETTLLALLDEVLFVVDTADVVPVAVHVAPAPTGAVRVRLDGADPRSVEPTGAAPKAISRSGLRVHVEPTRVECAFIVDV